MLCIVSNLIPTLWLARCQAAHVCLLAQLGCLVKVACNATGADPDRVSREIEEVVGIDCSNPIKASAKMVLSLI